VGGGALGCEAAFAEEQDFSTGGERVGNVVSGEDGLDAVLEAPVLQAGKERVAGEAVERGKRLVEEKQAGRWGECAGEGDALRLAAGEILRAARGETGCVDEGENLVYSSGASGTRESAQAVGDVFGGGHVRKERGVLRNERGVATARAKPEAGSGVNEGLAVEDDAAREAIGAARAVEAGEEAEERGFAGAGGSEDDGPIGSEGAGQLKVEAAAMRVEHEIKHGATLRAFGLRAFGLWNRWRRGRGR